MYYPEHDRGILAPPPPDIFDDDFPVTNVETPYGVRLPAVSGGGSPVPEAGRCDTAGSGGHREERILCQSPHLLYVTIAGLLGGKIFNDERMSDVFIVEGQYQKGDSFYDYIHDLNTPGEKISAHIPQSIRSRLEDGETYYFFGNAEVVYRKNLYINFHVQDAELKAKKHMPGFDPLLAERAKLMDRKLTLGKRSPDISLRIAVQSGKPFNIYCIYGKKAVVDKDVDFKIGNALSLYPELKLIRLNTGFGTAESIAKFLDTVPSDADMIILIRGGGDEASMSVFDSPVIASKILDLQEKKQNLVFLSALGHQVNNSLTDKIADRTFITPTDFGYWIRDSINAIKSDESKEHALLADKVKQQYEEQSKKLAEQIAFLQKQLDEKAEFIKKMREEKNKDADVLRKSAEETSLELKKRLENAEKKLELAVQEKDRMNAELLQNSKLSQGTLEEMTNAFKVLQEENGKLRERDARFQEALREIIAERDALKNGLPADSRFRLSPLAAVALLIVALAAGAAASWFFFS